MHSSLFLSELDDHDDDDNFGDLEKTHLIFFFFVTFSFFIFFSRGQLSIRSFSHFSWFCIVYFLQFIYDPPPPFGIYHPISPPNVYRFLFRKQRINSISLSPLFLFFRVRQFRIYVFSCLRT